MARWRKRPSVPDARLGPEPASTGLSAEREALAVALRRPTLPPLHECLYALQATLPPRSRPALHRLLQRHGISRLPAPEPAEEKKKFKDYPIGYLPVDFAEVHTDRVGEQASSWRAFGNERRTAQRVGRLLRLNPDEVAAGTCSSTEIPSMRTGCNKCLMPST